MKPSLCVVLHDVAPATHAACQRVIRAVADVADVPLTLLTVPRYRCEPTSAEFGAWLKSRQAGGDEIALHGYTHQDDGVPSGFIDRLRRRYYVRGEGEFCDLSMTEAMRRLTAGVRWFSRQGLHLHGFVAPAWLMSPGTWEALRWLDLQYTCTLRRIVLLPDGRHFTSRGLVYRPASAWGRQVSIAWNSALAAMQRRNPLLRLELHPGDADHSAVRLSWQRLLHEHLAKRRATTLVDVAEQFRLRTDWDLLDGEAEEEQVGFPLPDSESLAHSAAAEAATSRHAA
jgi:predicted deacetylase